MPQPQAVTDAAERLIAVYDEAHAELVRQYEAAVLEPSKARAARRLRELIQTNEAIVDGLVDSTRTWMASTIAEVHALGAQQAADAVGSSFAWTAPHTAAVQEFAEARFDGIAAQLQNVREDTRAALRAQARDKTRSVLLENKTAAQAGKELAREAADNGLFEVTYSNGAKHTVADWADSTIRTTTAEAFNNGTLTQCRGDGIEHVEYFDGAGCCVGPGHKVGPLANGLVVHIDDVVSLSHPRCLRSLGPRPDVTDPTAARPTAPDFTSPSLPPEPVTIPAGRQQRAQRASRAARS